MSANPPPEDAVGARIRVRPEHAEEAALLFAQAGFEPLHVEHRSDGTVSFWFGKMASEETWRLATAIPVAFYALQAFVDSPPPR